MNINYEYSTDTECSGNTYNNCRIAITSKNKDAEFNINNENIRPNEVNRKNKNIEKIDINTAGIDDIKKLPGITIISAKKLIQYREYMVTLKIAI